MAVPMSGNVTALRAAAPARIAGALIVAVATIVGGCSKGPVAPTSLGITSQPQSQTVQAGARATLRVSGAGGGTLRFQWYEGQSGQTAAPIDGAVGETYTTPPLMATAQYWVRLSTGADAVDSATATVTVAGGAPPTSAAPGTDSGTAPVITTQPASPTIDHGDAVTLVVAASGTTPFTYQWYQGTAGDTSSPLAGETTTRYKTPSLTVTTSYWVRVTNAVGSTDSVTAIVTVGSAPPPGATPDPPAITTPPLSQSIVAGDTATLTVVATGTAPLAYQWYAGASGQTDNPLPGETTASYKTASLYATATYWVRVSNAAGTVDSTTATVTVSTPPSTPGPEAPVITTHPQDRSVASGQSVTLSVGATGTAPLAYQWYVGSSGATGSPIAGATGVSYTTPALTSTTSYWARVSNAAGTADSNAATVTVNAASGSAAFEDEVLALVNAERAAGATCGGTPYPAVGPLSMNEALRTAAREHSQDMGVQDYFSHTSLDGRTFDQRMRDAGYSGAYPWGENIAAGMSTPAGVVSAWMGSTGHCKNIMSGSYHVIGVGYANVSGSTYRHYWTQDFGGS